MGLRQVVVIAADQKHYLGGVEEEELGLLQEMRPVKLKDVYQLCILDQTAVDPTTGKMAGLSRSYMLMNVGSAPDSLKELNITPIGWYDPQTCGLERNFDGLITQVSRNNARTNGDLVRAGAGALAALDSQMSLKEIIGKR